MINQATLNSKAFTLQKTQQSKEINCRMGEKYLQGVHEKGINIQNTEESHSKGITIKI